MSVLSWIGRIIGAAAIVCCICFLLATIFASLSFMFWSVLALLFL